MPDTMVRLDQGCWLEYTVLQQLCHPLLLLVLASELTLVAAPRRPNAHRKGVCW